MPGARPAAPAGCSATRPRPCCWRRRPAGSPAATTRPRPRSAPWPTVDDAAFLGLRGLLRQAIEREDWAEATALARQAEAVEPGAAWLRRERFRLAVRAGEWSDALALADADAPKAALAAAAAEAESDAGRALRLAKQAWQDDPSLSPAALAYATRLRAAGRESRALAVIRHSWAIAPHPDLADFALAPVSDTLQRTQAAQRLTEANPDHAESRLLLARTALEAGLTGEARRHAEAAAATGLNQRRLWLLLAEIAEAEGGDSETGRLAQRDALRRAAAADPDPTWQLRRLPHRACVMASELSGLLHGRQPALAHGSGGDAAHSPGPRGNNPYRERLTNCCLAPGARSDDQFRVGADINALPGRGPLRARATTRFTGSVLRVNSRVCVQT